MKKREQDIKDKLDQISPSMCLAKWYQVTLHLHSGHNHSCHHPRTHKISLEEIEKDPSALHNTEYKKEQRKMMIEGKRPPECQYCWNIEDSGGTSDRITKSSDPFCAPQMDQVLATDREELWKKNINPKYVEISFDYTCNMKCAYCLPNISSQWHQEILQHGPYQTETAKQQIIEDRMPLLKREHNPYVEAWWKWWPDLKKDLHTLRVTGGEPLLSKDCWKLFDQLEHNPEPNINFEVNSNLNHDRNLIDKFINKINSLEGKIKDFTLYGSLDTGIASHTNYVRFGLDHDLYLKNLEYILENVKWPIKYSTMTTVTNLSSIGLKPLLEYHLDLVDEYKQHHIMFDTPYLRNPPWMEIRIGRDITRPYIQTAYDYLNDKQHRNTYKIERMLNFIDNNTLDPARETTVTKDFYKYWSEYDRRRGTDFCKTFPEFTEFYYKSKEMK